MKKNILALLILATALAVCAEAQKAPFWGGNPRYSVKVKFVYNDPIANWTFNYFYDWNRKAARYEHGAGNYD